MPKVKTCDRSVGVRRLLIAAAIGVVGGVAVVAAVVATWEPDGPAPWGLMFYAAPAGALIGVVLAVFVSVGTRLIVLTACRLGAHTLGTVIVATVSAVGCGIFGYLSVGPDVPNLGVAVGVSAGIIGLCGALAESSATRAEQQKRAR